MKRFVLICLALTAFSPFAFAISADEQASRDAALRYLALVDSGQYQKAWLALPPRVRAGLLQENVLRYMRARRAPVGHPRTRQFLKVEHMQRLNGWPDGDYMVIYFKTSFEHKATALERVVLTRETGHWEVGAYGFR